MRRIAALLALLSTPALAQPADLNTGARRIEAPAAPIAAPPGGPARFRVPARVAHMDTAQLYVRTGAGRAEVPRTQWGFVDNRTIQLLPIGRAPDPQQTFELSYEAYPGS